MDRIRSLVLTAVITGCAFDADEVFLPDADPSFPQPGAVDTCVPGEVRACGDCGEGIQTCKMVDEFVDWGRCEGASASCLTGPEQPELPSTADVPTGPTPEDPGTPKDPEIPESTPPDLDPNPSSDTKPEPEPEPEPEPDSDPGSDPGSDPTPDPGVDLPPDPPSECFAECVPGATRFCHFDDGCLWGLQQCGDDRFWGECLETAERPSGCEGWAEFDRACCDASSDACCANWPDGGSLGECAEEVPCWESP